MSPSEIILGVAFLIAIFSFMSTLVWLVMKDMFNAFDELKRAIAKEKLEEEQKT